MKIILAPSYDLAEKWIQENKVPDATVEAEYGDKVIEGSVITLAHHGERSSNPAPCNDPRADKVNLNQDAVILVSHMDLDTVGGIMKLQGKLPEDPEFWKAAEYIDVNGPHHVYELDNEIQNKLNAVYAWEQDNRKPIDRNSVTDITANIDEYSAAVDKAVDLFNEEHINVISRGAEWAKTTTNAVENCLLAETTRVRVFATDGPFCNASYYSPTLDKIIPAVVSFNKKFNSITLSFEDGGKEASAKEIVQALWGSEAGGREGIAGSPRGQEMTLDDLLKISQVIDEGLSDRDIEPNQEQDMEQEVDLNQEQGIDPAED